MLKWWNAEMMKCWNTEILKCWYPEILECWNYEVWKCWNTEMLKCSKAEMLKYRNAEMGKCINTEMLTCFIVLKCWNAEMLELWHYTIIKWLEMAGRGLKWLVLSCLFSLYYLIQTNKVKSYGYNLVEKSLMDAQIIAKNLMINYPVTISVALVWQTCGWECENCSKPNLYSKAIELVWGVSPIGCVLL